MLALGVIRDRWRARSAVPVRVRSRRGAGRAHYEPLAATIAVPTTLDDARGHRWAMRELVILHELAHHLEPGAGAGKPLHGIEFRAAMLALVEAAIGPETALLLRVTYADVGLAPA